MATSPRDPGRNGARPLDQRELKKFPGYLLARARFQAFKTFEQAVRERFALKPVEFSVMVLLASNREVTQTQLSQALGVAAPNMTGLLRRLQERGFIERERAATDARLQYIALTAEGQETVAQVQAVAKAADKSWMGRLSKAEQAMLMELLEKVTAA